MQLKKMREILPRLYPGQVNDKNNSLTTSPKQSPEDKTNPSKGDDDQNCCYQGTEAENNQLSLISCIKCRSVQRISMQDTEKHKKLGWTEDKNFICKKCSHITPPVFHFVPEGANAVEKHEKKSPSKAQRTFKVKNFLPGKYYCDKCRFSTKDPLQYKKHVGQHEEIKFICFHCSYVSYTKGEFQRHLVKHTGVFPYQCEYCEYGAVRHDYIVKHTRRVHETPTKRLSKNIINHKQKKQSQSILFEKQKYDKIPFQNELPNSSSNMVCEVPGKATKTVCLSRDVECSVNMAPVQDKTVLEPSEISVCENQSVEVEVYSPKTEPLEPGMPLTVIAPSELVVPSNCLAQIVEIKIVNGAQQLVLKLIPMKEATYKPVNNPEEELENQGMERSAEGRKTSSVSQNELLTMEVNVDKLSSVSSQLNLDSTYDKNSECLCSSDSQISDYNSVSVHREEASKLCFHLVKGIDVHSGVIELCSQSLVINSTEKKNNLKSSRWEVDGKNNLHYDLYCYEEGVDIPCPKYAAISEDKSYENTSVEAAQEGKKSSVVLEQKDPLPLKSDDKECRSLPVSSTETHLAGNGFDKKSVTPSEARKNLNVTKIPPCKDLTFDFSKAKRAETVSQKNSHLVESLELQKMENKGNPLEGPVISSVFSLSSGAENVPEGVRWDDTTCSKKSATLLCRKIAQLMSAAESNMKSMPMRCQASSRKVLFHQENSSGCERVSAAEVEQPASLPPGHGGNSVINSEEHSKDQFLTFARTSKSRVTKNSHVATPVFIPKGTMLRVLNATSSQNSNGIENRSEASASVYCNEMFLPRPVPVSVSETVSNLPCLPNQSEWNAESRSISLRQRPRREAGVKNHSKQTGVPFQKSSDLNKQSRPYSKSQLGPKNKAKQSSFRELSKRKTRTQSETSSDMSYLLTARRLRLVPLRMNQLIKCPRRNQPVVVLNHPDVDSPEIINVMKTINKYKGQVLKVVLSERTSSCLGVKRYRKRLTLQNVEIGNQVKKQSMLKMKLKKTHKNNYQVVENSPAETLQCLFKCWFCGRVYMDQEEWISHGQRHLIEATKGWDVLSLSAKKH
ncbi:zinc finger protein 518B [Falco biarmicus]|uniref:zinc finger protein 518B n=1 Tax=Falco biarmicus TaxID=345155 RepID=UPI0024BC2DE0|nr:zinc finger protein 518B [Falco biarmicus]XP_056192915.1 zinc finger protein 518B [Falco biarmicus]XP_056192925.1 zinc finger protein 518B [Falco biarmicus]XP_056192932.1 zinc finger protein 518B [Falco biarmicus]